MDDFYYRTEDILLEDIESLYVETRTDRAIVDALKSRNPVVLVGSRGVGKSFLLRVAQSELLRDFQTDRTLPVYMTFVKGSLLNTNDEDTFQKWMLSKICTAIIKTLSKEGLIGRVPNSISALAGENISSAVSAPKIQGIVDALETRWRNPGTLIDTSLVPDVGEVKDSIEEIAEDLNIKRFAIFFDEAAHIFVPEQQRTFFSIFRDLRSPRINCNAAVYPGVTSFGSTFQPSHDAKMININRDILSSEYVSSMREIVEKQADSTLQGNIARNGQNFATLAYAATGNPRILLKSIDRSRKMSSTEIAEVFRNFYLTDIWSEHTALSDKYEGKAALIDWGRSFIDNEVLPQITEKNRSYVGSDKNTSAYFWIHKDAPEEVKEAVRILCYTGLVVEEAAGIKATRSEIGTRYLVNLGCLFAHSSATSTAAYQIATSLTPKRMTEFGSNHTSYAALLNRNLLSGATSGFSLSRQLAKPIEVLDLTEWQLSKLVELDLKTIGDVLGANEDKLQSAYYVGPKRARIMRNAATSSVLEYLSG